MLFICSSPHMQQRPPMARYPLHHPSKGVPIMSTDLKDKRIAVLMTDGVEQTEYAEPRQFLEQQGAKVTLISTKEKGEDI
jgi:hypothetical protein